MNKELIEAVRNFVEEECKKPGANYGSAYEDHFITMHNYAVKLAGKFDADLEVVEIAAWLHDIGSIIYGRADHHITGAKIAEDKLKEFDYPEDKIAKVKFCILNHRGSAGSEGDSPELRVIIEADTLSAFDDIGGLFEAALVYEHKSRKGAVGSVMKKLKNKYNQLLPEAKSLVQKKYDTALVLMEE